MIRLRYHPGTVATKPYYEMQMPQWGSFPIRTYSPERWGVTPALKELAERNPLHWCSENHEVATA